ncbi:MAG TPA: hypothetical protein P5084_08655 [Paludibacter sp.]|nr:hypothetical protein [Paludibacter sp.]
MKSTLLIKISLSILLICSATNLVSQNINDNEFWFPGTSKAISIVENLPSDMVYLIYNNTNTSERNSNFNVSCDDKVLMLNNKALTIYEGGSAMIQSKNISLLHSLNSKSDMIGYYKWQTGNRPNNLGQNWTYNGSDGACLIAHLLTPHRLQFRIEKTEPALKPGEILKFVLYVDDKPIKNQLYNLTSIDVYGSRIAIAFADETSKNTFKVYGSYFFYE